MYKILFLYTYLYFISAETLPKLEKKETFINELLKKYNTREKQTTKEKKITTHINIKKCFLLNYFCPI